jgi:hypothetical protein
LGNELEEMLKHEPEPDTLHEKRKKLFDSQTEVKIQKTLIELDKLQKRREEGFQIENLSTVASLIQLEIVQSKRYESFQFSGTNYQAQRLLRQIIIDGKEKYSGTLVVELKSGYDAESQKYLSGVPLAGLSYDFWGLALRLKGTGFLIIRHE